MASTKHRYGDVPCDVRDANPSAITEGEERGLRDQPGLLLFALLSCLNKEQLKKQSRSYIMME